jgi:hypothetical protein
VPADAFYEWRVVKGGKQPYAIARQDGELMAFAGLWEGFRWADGNVTRSFAIITTDASADVAELHDRMPVILEPEDWPVWLGEAPGNPPSLLHPSPAGSLRVWPVDRRVNSPLNKGPELLEAVGLVARTVHGELCFARISDCLQGAHREAERVVQTKLVQVQQRIAELERLADEVAVLAKRLKRRRGSAARFIYQRAEMVSGSTRDFGSGKIFWPSGV